MFTISVCLIVKNEESVLGRCLDCAKNFADEIIIIDTGSTDNTKSIASKYTDKIYDFIWCDDFSAARNHSFSFATKDYIMWLDADDVISQENIQKIIDLKNSNKNADVFMLKYEIAFDQFNNPTFVYYRERLLKRESNFVWQGFIHEAIVPRGKIEHLDIAIQHKKENKTSPKRNLKIYQKHLRNGDILSPREKFYYARELFYNEYYKKCIIEMKKFLKCPNIFLPNQIDAYKTISQCYINLNNRDKAIDTLFKSMKIAPPNAEICCLMGNLYVNAAPNIAIFWYTCALSCKKDTESGAFIESDYYDFIPYLQLCFLNYKLGNFEEAKNFHVLAKKLKPDDPAILYNQKFFCKDSL